MSLCVRLFFLAIGKKPILAIFADFTLSFSSFPGLNLGTFFAGAWIVSVICGLTKRLCSLPDYP
jgi:hypothetical protein